MLEVWEVGEERSKGVGIGEPVSYSEKGRRDFDPGELKGGDGCDVVESWREG